MTIPEPALNDAEGDALLSPCCLLGLCSPPSARAVLRVPPHRPLISSHPTPTAVGPGCHPGRPLRPAAPAGRPRPPDDRPGAAAGRDRGCEAVGWVALHGWQLVQPHQCLHRPAPTAATPSSRAALCSPQPAPRTIPALPRYCCPLQWARACRGRSSAARLCLARSAPPSCWRRCACSRACWPPSASEGQGPLPHGCPALQFAALPGLGHAGCLSGVRRHACIASRMCGMAALHPDLLARPQCAAHPAPVPRPLQAGRRLGWPQT